MSYPLVATKAPLVASRNPHPSLKIHPTGPLSGTLTVTSPLRLDTIDTTKGPAPTMIR